MAPWTRLHHFSPVFPVKDLRRALDHYASLGFVTNADAGGDEYGFADRDGIGLHLEAGPGRDPGQTYLYVEDADALYEEWTRPGIGGSTRRVHDTEYRLREGAHIDPDGNLIRFGSPLVEPPEVTRLREHLESQYRIEVAGLSELDLRVFRVDRRDGPSWVARCFPSVRPMERAEGDGEILRFLAEADFPAERCAAPVPTSIVDGRPVLVTEHIAAVPRNERRATIRNFGGLRHLGALLGRLHAMPEGTGAVCRQGGAWHHLADGGPGEEIAAAQGMLHDAADLVPTGQRHLYDSISAELHALDDCTGLPQALIHPDFVLANVVASPDRGLVVVDWTGAGRGPRLWSLAFFLFSEGAKNLHRVARIVAGYRPYIRLEPEELSRLATVMRARPAILASWVFCTGRSSLAVAAQEMAARCEIADAVAAQARAAFADQA